MVISKALKVEGLMPLTFAACPEEARYLAVKDPRARAYLLGALAGAAPFQEGKLFICGVNAARRPLEARAHVGYVPAKPMLESGLSLEGNLRLFWDLREMGRGFAPRREEVLALLGLDKLPKGPFGRLSPEEQRLGALAAALLHDPEVLILDGDVEEELLERLLPGRSVILGTADKGLLAVEENH